MVAGHVLTRYAPDGTPITQAFLEWAGDSAGATYPPVSLSVLPDGRVLFATKRDRAFVFDSALGSASEVAAPGAGGEPRWAFRTRLTPSGRALCLLGENVVAVSREPIGAALPALTAVTALSRTPNSTVHSPVYCPPTGASGEGEPRTGLVEQIRAAHPGPGGPRPAWVYDVVVDQARRRIFHLNTFGLYVFDDSGTRTAWLSTDDKEYRPLAHFQLREFDPAGQLVLVHEKQNLVLTVPVPDDLADLPGAVTDALALFRKERTRLKKEYRPPNLYWTTAGTPLASFSSR